MIYIIKNVGVGAVLFALFFIYLTTSMNAGV